MYSLNTIFPANFVFSNGPWLIKLSVHKTIVLPIGVRAHFLRGSWAEFARMTRRHRFRDVIIKLYNLRRLQMKGFPLKIDKRDIKRNMSSPAISIIS